MKQSLPYSKNESMLTNVSVHNLLQTVKKKKKKARISKSEGVHKNNIFVILYETYAHFYILFNAFTSLSIFINFHDIYLCKYTSSSKRFFLFSEKAFNHQNLYINL